MEHGPKSGKIPQSYWFDRSHATTFVLYLGILCSAKSSHHSNFGRNSSQILFDLKILVFSQFFVEIRNYALGPLNYALKSPQLFLRNIHPCR